MAVDYLKYCNVCKNRKWDMQTGVICGLTAAKPTFENHCESYHYAPEAYQKLVEDRRAFYDKVISREMFASKEETVVEPTALLMNHRVKAADQLPPFVDAFMPFPIKLIFRKPQVRIDGEGIRTKRGSLRWDEIIFTGYMTEWTDKNDGKSKIQSFIADAVSPAMSLKLSCLWDISRREFGHYVEMYKSKYSLSKP